MIASQSVHYWSPPGGREIPGEERLEMFGSGGSQKLGKQMRAVGVRLKSISFRYLDVRVEPRTDNLDQTLLPDQFTKAPLGRCLLVLLLVASGGIVAAPTTGSVSSIDRHALVTRNNIKSTDVTGALSLGNGEFAVSIDGTGVQSFAGNTLAHWGWHRFPLPRGYTMADIPYTGTYERGHLKGPQVWPQKHAELGKWLYENPHTLNLGRLRLRLDGADLTGATVSGLTRKLDLWSGIHSSSYSLAGKPVTVRSVVHPTRDLVAVHIESALLADGALTLGIDFPYATAFDEAPAGYVGTWDQPDRHRSEVMAANAGRLVIRRVVDDFSYTVTINATGGGAERAGAHAWTLKAPQGADSIDVIVDYTHDGEPTSGSLPTFAQTAAASARKYAQFWNSGGAIDLSASTDPRWKELERRIVLSQYLMAAQSAGSQPPEESGLTTQSWSGQFHMEMMWWHLAHYGLWDRWAMGEQAIDFYQRAKPRAAALAQQLDYRGLMWPKMTGPEGRNSVWEGNNILQWKEPHPIFFAELEYRLKPSRATLDKWREIVFGTADFMADYPVRNTGTETYSLEPLMTANERYIGKDGVFELAYWRFGLEKAQEWRHRLGLPREPKWDEVLKHLAPLPTLNDPLGRVYIECSEWSDNYTPAKAWEHPDPIGVYGMLPLVDGVDPQTARNTVRKVWETWDWNKTWGWDFPWIAMAAARTGQPEIAIDALLSDAAPNRYAESGINEGWYMPGNGGLLYATAMMAAGWEGARKRNAPGFPDNGRWSVRWEGLKRAP